MTHVKKDPVTGTAGAGDRSAETQAHPRGGAPRGRIGRKAPASDLCGALLALLRRTPCTVQVISRPEAFRWFDGHDGRRKRHRPLALVRRADGHDAYVDALPRAVLRRDPELGGLRRRIELECLARGACYEIWTEGEVREDRTRALLVRVADAGQRSDYKASPGGGVAPVPILVSIARRLSLRDLRPVGSDWVGMSSLTGILMSVGWHVEVDPATRLVVWSPFEASLPSLVAQVASAWDDDRTADA